MVGLTRARRWQDLRVITAGVDLASQAAATAAAVIEWSGGRAVVVEVATGVDDDRITRLVAGTDKVGIDVPLGWPVAFVEAVGSHARDGSWPAAYVHAEDTSALRFRRTDLWLWGLLKSPPLSVSTDRIALPAMRAAALLARMPERLPIDGSGVVVEAYPAGALRRWGFPSRNYKRKDNAAVRRELLDRLLAETAGWLRIEGPDAERCCANDDALDAVVAALIARAAAIGLVEEIPPAERAAARREGWVAVPFADSLGRLA
jgi:Protein of unknown function (DUF429)